MEQIETMMKRQARFVSFEGESKDQKAQINHQKSVLTDLVESDPSTELITRRESKLSKWFKSPKFSNVWFNSIVSANYGKIRLTTPSWLSAQR